MSNQQQDAVLLTKEVLEEAIEMAVSNYGIRVARIAIAFYYLTDLAYRMRDESLARVATIDASMSLIYSVLTEEERVSTKECLDFLEEHLLMKAETLQEVAIKAKTLIKKASSS